MEVIGPIIGISMIALWFTYFVGIWWYTRIYFLRRHGVHLEWPIGVDNGVIGAACVGIIWPIVVFFLPNVKYPQLCSHRHHVLARHQARQEIQREDESFQEALRQEKGEG